jgi:hypothetical protein
MTYPELRAAAFIHAAELLAVFERSSVQGTMRGALVFLPEGYRPATSFAEVHYEYYDVDRLSAVLLRGEPLPADMMDILKPFEAGQECAVCIVEDPDETGRSPVHVHRVTRFFSN